METRYRAVQFDHGGFVSPTDPSPFSWLYAIHRPTFFDGIQVGSDGGVWSCWNTRWGKSNRWKRLSGALNHYGYIILCMPPKTPFVHRMILEAFVGSCPDGMECRHLNGRSDDNRLVNLAWGTAQENGADRSKHGTVYRGGTVRDPNRPRSRAKTASM